MATDKISYGESAPHPSPAVEEPWVYPEEIPPAARGWTGCLFMIVVAATGVGVLVTGRTALESGILAAVVVLVIGLIGAAVTLRPVK